jgi:hypothetical protein|tara:strand:- start:54 stop:494 length:441 start_codon:yes stop_codon:yes gene_type:complete
MFEDIVICEMYHTDPLGNEYCNPEGIAIGTTQDNGIMVSLRFREPDDPQHLLGEFITPLQISAETLGQDKIEIKDKYDVQEAVKISITDTIEIYDMIIGSNGQNFPYFTNIPAINNTTDFADTIYLNFPHAVEGFSFSKGQYKTFN